MMLDEDAIDASRITGIPWFYGRVHQRGPQHPMIDTRALGEVDRLRLAFAAVGAHYFMDCQGAPRGRSGDSDHVTTRMVGGGSTVG